MMRKAGLSDLESVVDLCEKVKENMIHNDVMQWDEFYPNPSVFTEDIAEENLFLMVGEDGLLLGCVVLNDFQDEEYGEIDWQYVDAHINVIHRLMVSPVS